MSKAQRDRGRVAVAALLWFAFVLAAGLLPLEFAHYRSVWSLPRDGGVRAAVLASLLAKTLVLCAPGVLAALALRPARRTRMAAALSGSWTVAVALFLLGDVAIQARMGRGLLFYGGFLGDPDAFRWAGGFDPLPLVIASAIQLAPCLVAALVLAGAVSFLARRRPGRVLAAAIAAWAIALGAAPLAQRAAPPSFALQRVAEHAPLWIGGAGLRSPAAPAIAAIENELSELYAHFRSGIAAGSAAPSKRPAPARGLPIARADSVEGASHAVPPHIVLLVVESFRFTALEPAVMPALSSLASRGVRFDDHLAGSNASHFGFFSLLYGVPALAYFETIERETTPPLLAWARAAGYRSHFLSGSEIQWMGMERFLNAENFDELHLQLEGANHQRDIATLERVDALLEGAGGPQLIIAFLMSTHFPFDHPAGHEPFQPTIEEPHAATPGLERKAERIRNRYRNAASGLDASLGRWLAGVALDRTLVLVTGDHGEAIFEDGTLTHASRLSAIQTRVPLVIAGAGVAARAPIGEPTSHAQIAATLRARVEAWTRSGGGPDSGSEPGMPGARGCIAVVQAEGRRSSRLPLLLLTGGGRHAAELERGSARVRLLGHLDERGLPSARTYRLDDAERAGACLAEVFERSRVPGS